MPPTRTVPPAKAVKTERTHEENQERAYIAASRRSDRSLEARVESARRASEIHKRRTGRSLKVTEQDVINEEMYEEEDDDLPIQYRRLTAHLQTNSPDFNRRLNAYLTNQVAMRSALGQGIINAYAQDLQNSQLNNLNAGGQPYFPSPMLAHQQQQQMMQPQIQQQQQQQPQQQQHSASPSTPRHAPYPSPRPLHQEFPSQHNRSASVASPQDVLGSTQNNSLSSRSERRLSMPVVSTEGVKIESSIDRRSPLSASAVSPKDRPSFPPGSFSQQNPYNQTPQTNYHMPPFGNGYNAFSLQLPQESQQMLFGSSSLQNDAMSSFMMQGNDNLAVPSHAFNPMMQNTMEVGKGQRAYPTTTGLDSTLVAPTDLDVASNGFDANQDYTQHPNFFDQAIDFDNITPAETPGVGGEPWSSYIDTDRWETPTSSQ